MTAIDHVALAIQFASCLFMTGVISVIQLIHFPSFARIDRQQFTLFHRHHSTALSLIAGPAMVGELLSTLWLARDWATWPILSAVSVVALWAATFFISVPAHNRLAEGFDEGLWRRLVATNWLRSAIWSVRSLVLVTWLAISLI